MFESETTETRPDYSLAALTLATELVKSSPPNTNSVYSPKDLKDATLVIAEGFLTFLNKSRQ